MTENKMLIYLIIWSIMCFFAGYGYEESNQMWKESMIKYNQCFNAK